jgi:nicotinamide mononucleotide transporter
MNTLSWLFDAQLTVPETQLLGWTISESHVLWREIIGNLFGLASAVGGMRRRVWAWPVGIVGNVLLFTVFLGAVFGTPQNKDLWGQAGRQVFFIAVAVYGWNRWRQAQESGGGSGGPVFVPTWAGWGGRLSLVAGAVVGTVVFFFVFRALGSWGPLPDAWIFTGSILATYGMARGWTEFWLIWIGVDIVGVPLLLQAGYYPSALLYIVYGVFVTWGFVVWAKAQRISENEPELVGAGAGTVGE